MRTRLEREAAAELLDAAADVAAVIGGRPDPSEELGVELAAVLGRLYSANDAWQVAQCEAAALSMKRTLRALKRRVRPAR